MYSYDDMSTLVKVVNVFEHRLRTVFLWFLFNRFQVNREKKSSVLIFQVNPGKIVSSGLCHLSRADRRVLNQFFQQSSNFES